MFQVDASVTASISGLTITGGNTTGNGGGLYNDGHGHADQLHRQRQLRQCNGGGLCNTSGTATLTDCTVSGNSATGYGGGLYNYDGGTTTLTNCTDQRQLRTQRRRRASGYYSNDYGTTTLTNCTVSGNSATSKAAACTTGFRASIDLGNTIVAGNTATDQRARCLRNLCLQWATT